MKKRNNVQKMIIFVIVLLIALVFVYPLFLIVMNSVKPIAEILVTPLSLPKAAQASVNYAKAFEEINVLNVEKKSLLILLGHY